MGIIIEIVLTVFACVRCHQAKKGWALGLIPLGVALAAGALLGVAFGSTGGALSDLVIIGAFMDIGVIIALIWMIIANKPVKTLPPEPPASIS